MRASEEPILAVRGKRAESARLEEAAGAFARAEESSSGAPFRSAELGDHASMPPGGSRKGGATPRTPGGTRQRSKSPNGKGGGKGKGKKRSNSQGKGYSPRKPDGCWNWATSGECKFGDGCKFKHGSGGNKDQPSQAAMASARRYYDKHTPGWHVARSPRR